ncbi:MAG: hypothetical protein GY847_14815 [Proteobacteria bacterium]|nr:hypothetical protein [Pseudomonadota bacterium]
MPLVKNKNESGHVGSATRAASGGTILLEAPRVEIAGVLAANGGGGGAGDLSCDGAYGRPSDSAAPGGVATGAANGGNGSAGDNTDGISGNPYESLWSAGGGGGGVGWIRINTSDGLADITGIISPSTSTGCASLGTLTF